MADILGQAGGFRAATKAARELAQAEQDRFNSLPLAEKLAEIAASSKSEGAKALKSRLAIRAEENKLARTSLLDAVNNAKLQYDAERQRLDQLFESGQITRQQRIAGIQAAGNLRREAADQASAQRSAVARSQIPEGFVSDPRTPEQRYADIMQSNDALQASVADRNQIFEQVANLPPIPASQAPVQQTMLTPTTGQQSTVQQTTSPVGQSFLTGQPTGTAMVNPLSPSNLPALRGAASGTSSIDPTLRPYLELGLRGAEQLFLQQQPSLYPGQMFVSPSEQTQAALNMQEDLALAQPTTLQAAQESFMRGLGGLGATAGGAFLMGSPYRQQVIESATRPLVQQFEQTTLPGISSQFSAAGRYGSGAMERAVGTATEATGRAIGDIASNIAYQDYANERQRQQQALGLQIQGATVAPQIYGQQFLPSQQLAQVGAARESIAAQPLQEAIQRYQFQQQIPYQQLQGFLSSVYGTPMAGSQYAPPAQTNPAANVLGSAALGAGIGNMIGGNLGGFSSTAVGAGLGALGGLLF